MKVGMTAFGVFAAAFVVMALADTSMVCAVGRFRNYVKILKDREYCDIKELAQRTGRSAKAVVKDLKKMIRKGWFRQGHLDEKEACLMVSDDAYHQYTELMERMKKEKAEREAAAKRQQKEFSGLSPEVSGCTGISSSLNSVSRAASVIRTVSSWIRPEEAKKRRASNSRPLR